MWELDTVLFAGIRSRPCMCYTTFELEHAQGCLHHTLQGSAVPSYRVRGKVTSHRTKRATEVYV